jgi:drug/metabolite transporter (DMT)-like permease
MKHYLYLHIAVLLAGFTGILGKSISLNEGLLVWYRVLFASIILFFIVKVFRKSSRLRFREKWEIIQVGLLITVHWIFFYASIKYANVSIGVVCYCLTGFFTSVFKPLIYKTRFRLSELMLSILSISGIGLIFHFETSYRTGILLGLVSAALGALYTIYNARIVKKYDNLTINYYQMLGGAVGLGLLLPLYLHYFPVEHFFPGWSDTFYLILLALFCTVVQYFALVEALKKIPVFTINLSFNLEPIYSILLAFLIFNESKEVNFSFYAGLGVIIAAVVLQTFLSVKSPPQVGC